MYDVRSYYGVLQAKPQERSLPIERNLLCQRPKVGSFIFVGWGKILANDNLR